MVRKPLNATVFAWLLALSAMAPVNGAELAIDNGVVVKLGTGAALVVRDKASIGKGALLTSAKDDTAGGSLDGQAHTPQAGDWAGVRVEKSASAYGFSINDSTLRYAGGSNAAALLLRGYSPTLTYLHVWDSVLGLQLQEGAAPAVSGGSFLRNTVAVQTSDNSQAAFSGSDFSANGTAINNLTPATVITATGNWWGDASGPADPLNNPAGLGSPVSSGVNYAGWSTVLPLINPQITLAGGSNYALQATVQLSLACQNAAEYRIAENGNFSGVDFKPMAATVSYTLSSGDGSKNLSVQYRASTGNTVTVAMESPIILDTVVPLVSITNPAAGSYLSKAISFDASASDASGIQQVDFYVDNVLKGSDSSAPYSYAWDVTTAADGEHVLKAVAIDRAGRSSSAQHAVVKGVPPPDATGPTVSEFKLGTQLLADGSVLTQSGTLSVQAADPSGVATTEYGVDGVKLSSAALDLYAINDGAHTLYVKVSDSVGNSTTVTYAVTVALAAPASAPAISAPLNGLKTSQAQQPVSGTAPLQTQVQVYNNGVAAGSPVAVDAAGKFSTSVVLQSGSNSLTAAALNRGGSSAASTPVVVSLDASVPQTRTGLVAQAQTAGRIKLSWLKSGDASTVGYHLYRSALSFSAVSEASRVNSTVLTGTSYDDFPAPDGSYNYRVIAVNSLGTASAPSNLATAVADSTLPRATQIVYQPNGPVDAATGRIGKGRVNVTLNTSEALLTTPFLSLAPQSGSPITLVLTKQSATQYSSYFDITENSVSGTYWAVFSAYDLIGNRGTDVDAGQSLLIDAKGPVMTAIALSPAVPIKNDAQAPVTVVVNFTLDEAVKPGTQPHITWLLSGSGRSPVELPLTQSDETHWRGEFALPADAGQNGGETLTFAYSAQDNLDNTSSQITATNQFEVYLGDLPAAAVPAGLTATAQKGGKVLLRWNTVSDASAYQLYRQAPGETQVLPLVRVSGLEYTDSTGSDGQYIYSVASVRTHNSQEALSAQSAPVTVNADATPPGAPVSLSLSLLSTGIKAVWLPPSSGAFSYNLYRSSAGVITSLAGLTPIKTGITQTTYTDPNPSLTDHSYVVTGVDAAGNESDISNSAYLNFGLLPVNSISIVQTDSGLPQISWTHTSQTIAGYDLYVGPDEAAVKLNDALLNSLSYTDSGYNGNERRYSVVAVDSNNEKAARSLVLPRITLQAAAGSVIRRGVMNRLQWQLKNEGSYTLTAAHLVFTVAGRQHISSNFTLLPGQALDVPVIVGGYSELTHPAAATLTLVSEPNEGEKVQLIRNLSMDVADGSLTLSQQTETFTRGGTGMAIFTLANTSDVETEVLTATANGSQPSTELRFKLIDADGNVLATQSFKQALGNSVITLSNGQTVARIPAGGTFTSDPVAVAVPASAPEEVYLQLEVDSLHYHTGQADQVNIGGMKNRKTIVLTDTAYNGTVSSISPASSFGAQNIELAGQAIDRKTGQAVANVPLTLAFNVNGFERTFAVQTNASGAWSYSYTPQPTDAGEFKVSAVHPSLLDRPTHGVFSINRVTVNPQQIKLSTSRNYNQLVNLTVSTGAGSRASNLRLVYDPASQLGGAAIPGISVNLSAPVSLGASQNTTVPFSMSGNNDAPASGTVILDVYMDEFGSTPFAKVRIDYTLLDSKPSLLATPSYIDSGTSRDSSLTERFTIKNNGLADAVNLTAVLLDSAGNAAPAWASLAASGQLGTLAAGASRAIDLVFTPTSAVAEGVYTFKLRVSGDNVPTGDLVVSISVTQSGEGDLLFRAADIYTGTLDKNGVRIQGLAGTKVRVQNELVPSVDQTLYTDNNGEVFFRGLPAGSYLFRASAANHQDASGRLSIKPGVVGVQEAFLNYNLISVEWSVNEITIEDRYEIVVNATFETDVPAAVVVIKPAMVNLPLMQAGDVYNGELVLTNYGLVRADNVKAILPSSDEYLRYEFLSQVPSTLEAKQVFVLPYRLVALKSFDPDAQASGGGCFSYGNSAGVSYSYACANGSNANGGSNTGWNYNSGSSCSGSGSSGNPYGYGNIYGYVGEATGVSGNSGGAPAYTSMSGAQCIPACPHCNPGNSK